MVFLKMGSVLAGNKTHQTKGYGQFFGQFTILRNLNIQINPGRFTHPLQSFPGFEVRQVRFCSMHTINLGILQALNGSSLPLLCSHGCLPVSSFWCTQVVFYCYPMSFLGYLNLYPKSF